MNNKQLDRALIKGNQSPLTIINQQQAIDAVTWHACLTFSKL